MCVFTLPFSPVDHPNPRDSLCGPILTTYFSLQKDVRDLNIQVKINAHWTKDVAFSEFIATTYWKFYN